MTKIKLSLLKILNLKNKNILNASRDVKIHDKIEDYVTYTENVTYYKLKKLLLMKNWFSISIKIWNWIEDVIYLIEENKLISQKNELKTNQIFIS